MSDKKPNVFSQDMMVQANQTGDEIAKQVYAENKIEQAPMSDGEVKASEEMRMRTEAQLKQREELLRAQEEKARLIDERRANKQTSSTPKVEYNGPVVPPIVPPTDNGDNGGSDNNDDAAFNAYVAKLSEPQFNQPFDIIP